MGRKTEETDRNTIDREEHTRGRGRTGIRREIFNDLLGECLNENPISGNLEIQRKKEREREREKELEGRGELGERQGRQIEIQ